MGLSCHFTRLNSYGSFVHTTPHKTIEVPSSTEHRADNRTPQLKGQDTLLVKVVVRPTASITGGSVLVPPDLSAIDRSSSLSHPLDFSRVALSTRRHRGRLATDPSLT